MRAIRLKGSKVITTRSAALDNIFRIAKRYPVMTLEQEAKATPDQLVNHNLLFVVSVAKRYEHGGVELMDLFCEGVVGMIKASRNFDATLGFKFTSYAVNWIRAAITLFIESKRDTIKAPGAIHRIGNRVAREQMQEETEDDTAKRLGLNLEFLRLHKARPKVLSMQTENEEGEPMIEVQGDFFTDTLTNKNDQKQMIKAAISRLSKKEQQVINLRYFGEYNNTLASTGEVLSLTSERVRQLETQALAKLRNYIKI